MLDAFVDNTETEEATKAKLKELERLAKFGNSGYAHSSRPEASGNTLGSAAQERRNQGTICCVRVHG